MDAHQYLNAIRKRWVAITALTVLGLAGGCAYAGAQPVQYEATSSVYVASVGGDTTQAQLQGATYAQNVVQSFVDLATEPVVLDPVISKLKLNTTTAQLAEKVSADLQVNTVIIHVTATDGSPDRAARIADAITVSLSDAAATLSTTAKKATIVMHRVAGATVPTRASSPNWPFLLATGLGLGLLIGLAYALGRQALGTRILSEDEMRATPGLETVPFLGGLSHRRGPDQGANVMLADPHSVPAEEYRRVITNIEFAGVDRRIRSVTVTSAVPGDGKSTTAVNIASAAAERQQRVLLVDGDLRRPSVAEYLGIDGGVGLTNVLLGSATPAQAIQRVGEVDVLPAGITPPNVTQLVASDAMRRLLGELLMRYDFIVVDAPPLLPVVDALSFARLTDGAVVVARQRSTRRREFAMAIESLMQVDAAVLGVALNDVTRGDARYGYTYGYAPVDLEKVRAVAPGRDAGSQFFPDDEQHGAGERTAPTRPTFADR